MGNETLADYAVEIAVEHGATYAEARWERSSGNGFSLKNGVPQLGGFGEVEGLGVRLIFHGAAEYCSTDWMDKAHIGKLVNDAIKNASANARLVREQVMLSEEKPAKAKWEVKQKRKAEDVSVEEKFDILEGVEKTAMKSKLKLPSRYLSLGDSVVDKYFVNSEGSKIRSLTPHVDFLAVFTVQDGADSMQRHLQFDECGGYERLDAWDPEGKLVAEAKAISKVLKEGVKAPAGEIDIICSPEVVGIAAHESSGHPFEADRILGREGAQAGESFIAKDDFGLKLGSGVATVVDDPVIANSAGYYLYDDEGVKAERKVLMSGGVVAGFLLNRESAYKLNMKSNGSARALDYESEPLVRMSNTFLVPGDYSEEELFKGVKLGVYIKSFTEWNIDDKRYNQKYVSCEAYLIEKGEVTKPVRRAVIECTTPDFWGAMDAAGRKVELFPGTCGKGEPMQGVPVSMGGPHARLRGMRLGV